MRASIRSRGFAIGYAFRMLRKVAASMGKEVDGNALDADMAVGDGSGT